MAALAAPALGKSKACVAGKIYRVYLQRLQRPGSPNRPCRHAGASSRHPQGKASIKSTFPYSLSPLHINLRLKRIREKNGAFFCENCRTCLEDMTRVRVVLFFSRNYRYRNCYLGARPVDEETHPHQWVLCPADESTNLVGWLTQQFHELHPGNSQFFRRSLYAKWLSVEPKLTASNTYTCQLCHCTLCVVHSVFEIVWVLNCFEKVFSKSCTLPGHESDRVTVLAVKFDNCYVPKTTIHRQQTRLLQANERVWVDILVHIDREFIREIDTEDTD